MGEIAEDMVDGSCCSWCGVYFVTSHGYPVVCKGCTKEHGIEEVKKAKLQVAIYEEV